MQYFIGIDIHKATSHIVVLDGTTDLVVFDKNIRTKKDRFDAELALFTPAKILIESSTLARWVSDHLRLQGHEVIVGNPNNPLMYASRPLNRKNDREDAKALAKACKAGHFVKVHRVSDAHRLIQEVLGSRATIIRSRTMFVNRIRALFAAAGVVLPTCATPRFRSTVVRAGIPPRLSAAVAPLLDMLAMVEDQIAVVDRRIEALAAAHPVAQLLLTVPGVGSIVALAFIATIDDPTRFGSAHMLESYLGLVPTLHTSASAGHGGHISRMGPAYLRTLLVQAAWTFLRSTDPAAAAMQDWANLIGQRRGAKVAVTALARRLAGVLFAIWRDGKPFDIRQKERNPAAAAARPLVRRYQLKTARRVAAMTRAD